MKLKFVFSTLAFLIFTVFANAQILNIKKAEKVFPPPVTSKDATVIHYDYENARFLGTAHQDAWNRECAVRYRTDILSSVTGQYITEIRTILDDVNFISYIKLKIYDAGTTTEPGTILYEQDLDFWINGWNNIILDSPLEITGTDIWVSLEINLPNGGPAYIIGADNGPSDTDGQWIKTEDEWSRLSEHGLDYNWNIRAVCNEKVIDLTNNEITNPETGHLTNSENITVKIENLTQFPVSNFPIILTFNGEEPITETYTGTISGLTTEFYTFNATVDCSSPSTDYSINVCVNHSEDLNTENNCNEITVRNTYGEVCNAGASGQDEYITNVLFGDIDNSSNFGENGYENYFETTTTVLQGNVYNLTVTCNTSYSADDNGVWIDWNENGSFDDEGENVICEANSGAGGSWDIAIPANATPGTKRMRIRVKFDGNDCGSACDNSIYGEVEDYGIIVEAQDTYSVNFTVTDGNEPIENATISINLAKNLWEDKTNETGNVTFLLAPNSYNYTITKNEYHEISGTFEVDNSTVDIPITLLSLGLNDLTMSNISIFPNPTNGIFVIELTNTQFEKISDNNILTITDITGKIILMQELTNQKTQINLSEQNTGIYFISINNSNYKIVKH